MEDSGRAGPCELRQPPVLFLRKKKIKIAFVDHDYEQDYSRWWLVVTSSRQLGVDLIIRQIGLL